MPTCPRSFGAAEAAEALRPLPRFDTVSGADDQHFTGVQQPPAARSWQRKVQAEWAMLVRALRAPHCFA